MVLPSRATTKVRMSTKGALRRSTLKFRSLRLGNGKRRRQSSVNVTSGSSSSSELVVMRIGKKQLLSQSNIGLENPLELDEKKFDLHSDDLFVQLPDKVKSALLLFRRILVRSNGNIDPFPYDQNEFGKYEDESSISDLPSLSQRTIHALKSYRNSIARVCNMDGNSLIDFKENVLYSNCKTAHEIGEFSLPKPDAINGGRSQFHVDKQDLNVEPLFALGLSPAQIDRLINSPLWTPVSIEMNEDDASCQNAETNICKPKSHEKPVEQSWEVAVILRPQVVRYPNGSTEKEYKVIWKNWPWNDCWSLSPHHFDDGYKRIFAADLRERLIVQMASCMQQKDKQKFNELFPYFHKRHDYESYHRVQLRLFEQSINDDLEELDIAPIYFENWTNDERASVNIKYLTKCVMSFSNYREAETVGQALRLQYPEDAAGCDCKDGRCTTFCPCVRVLGRDQIRMRSTGKVNVEKLGDAITIGCGTTCSCTVDCPSRFAEKGRRVPLVVLYTVSKGWSVYTPQIISQGTFLGTYTGEIMPLCSAIAKGLPTTYQFTNIHQIPGTKQYVVDASRVGNETRYFNHACGDFANLKAVSLLSRGNLLTNNMIFFTKRTVSRGEELTFSYRAKDDEKQRIGMRCLCTPGCQTLL